MDEKGATFLCDLLKTSGVEPSEPAAPARYLIVLRGGLPGRMIRLTPGTQTLGRSSENDIQLPDMNVSRRHARVDVGAENLVKITDLGSSNGTFINGRRLAPDQAQVLREGDRIGFGPSALVKFDCPDACEEHYQRELFERAVRDPLTGLYNRGFFLDQGPLLERRAASSGLGLALMMLDVDHFKPINDTHGHPIGDLMLREVAAVIRQATRADDIVARYGGEEFVAAIPIGSAEHALRRAERIRSDLAARRLSLPTLAEPLRVTASLGLAFAAPGSHRSIPSLIIAADAALYQAKRTGRDRVVMQDVSPAEGDGPLTTIDFPSFVPPAAPSGNRPGIVLD